MNILFTGATGLIGSTLIPRLIGDNHQVIALSRNPAQAKMRLPAAVEWTDTLENYSDLNGFDAVINLAGEPIFRRRWTPQQKNRLIHSRVDLTKKLTALINCSSHPPHTFISGSAAGYYGDRGETALSEDNRAGDTFPARLCQQWEAAAQHAATRVCLLRTGIVLAQSGGALAQMLLPYRLGLGGKLGSGRQYWGWIALSDMVNAILFLLHHPQCHGAFNLSAPNPTRNSEFNHTLGSLLNRPHFAQVPAFLLRWAFGERAQLLLDSQKVLPTKLLQAGFRFQYPDIKSALVHCL
ncbi:TIGR01777 family oxidoreductase [Necropsobacter massiliensis]|uniref:TIGR01777 family oxidoreductase n=1 Tax=Necropsobacter massiliensis TaxID=1400001 RepID=UPI0005961394|nr:TIGR01777 family oxidoreductase [Necropsobacter massiliensis]